MQNIIDFSSYQPAAGAIVGQDIDRQVLRFIRDYTARNGFAPAMREIGAAVYLSLTSVARHLNALEMDGYLRRTPNMPRSIVLTGAAMPAPKRAPVPFSSDRLLTIADDVNQRAVGLPPVSAERIGKLLSGHGWRCVCCGKPDSQDTPLFVVHLLPLARSGRHQLSNLSPRCGRCAGREIEPVAGKLAA